MQPWYMEKFHADEYFKPFCRRNIFGPLHEIPKNNGNYWAGSFRTVGDKFSSEYQINPQGFFDVPDIFPTSDNEN